jgi:hypothetical protein
MRRGFRSNTPSYLVFRRTCRINTSLPRTKYMKNYLLLTLPLLFTAISNGVEAQTTPDFFYSQYPSYNIDTSQILDALIKSDINYAKILISNAVLEYLRSDKFKKQATQWGIDYVVEKLKKILNDPSKTEAQKIDEIGRLIDLSILPYESQQVDLLSLSYRASLEYGLARLSYNAFNRYEKCGLESGFTTQTTLNITGPSSTVYIPYYYDIYALRSPTIRVYRVADGIPDALILTFAGSTRSDKVGGILGFNDSTWSTIKDAYNLARNLRPDNLAFMSRPFVDVPLLPYLSSERRTGYRIVQDYASYLQCSAVSTSSQIWMDENKDGIPDIIPRTVYSAFLGKIYAPKLAVVNALLLED